PQADPIHGNPRPAVAVRDQHLDLLVRRRRPAFERLPDDVEHLWRRDRLSRRGHSGASLHDQERTERRDRKDSRSHRDQNREAMRPMSPGPLAVGSPSQSGGVSQTNARMAMTQRSYGSVARSSVQKNARLNIPATPLREGIGSL